VSLAVVEESADALPSYGAVPIAFRVETRFRVEPVRGGLGGLMLVEEPVAAYIKDYDADERERPANWPRRWDLSRWGILSAFDGPRRVGGAAVAWKTANLELLEGRDDLAIVWDLRVHPDWRGRGVGHLLFARALAWARERGCRRLKVETQDVNVPACRFYARQGCELEAIRRHAYDTAPDEVQLLWSREV
jgi:GNAT superfamily N-acetyltransferase